MPLHPLTERARGFFILLCAIILAAIFSWYPLYRVMHAPANQWLSLTGFLVGMPGLPLHFIIAAIAVKGFCTVSIPVLRGQRTSGDAVRLLCASVLALAGLSPLFICVWPILTS